MFGLSPSLWLWYSQFIIMRSLLVMPMLITRVVESVSPTDRHGCDALDFCYLLGYEQLVRCPNHIAGNKLDLVMTDAPDMVDVFVDTPLHE